MVIFDKHSIGVYNQTQSLILNDMKMPSLLWRSRGLFSIILYWLNYVRIDIF